LIDAFHLLAHRRLFSRGVSGAVPCREARRGILNCERRGRVALAANSVRLSARLNAGQLARFNYKIIEALTNWIGNAYSDGYPKQGLFPGQNLSWRLMTEISIEQENPRGVEALQAGKRGGSIAHSAELEQANDDSIVVCVRLSGAPHDGGFPVGENAPTLLWSEKKRHAGLEKVGDIAARGMPSM
jgi:hypothetical protein